METKIIINTLTYWGDISDCVCNNTTPIGGCLKCDMKKCIEQLDEIIPYIDIATSIKAFASSKKPTNNTER